MEKQRETFGGRLAVIMAMAGSAIGLGNIWRFPYMVGEFGGGAFILVYIVSSLVLSIPLFIAESLIGRRSRSNSRSAMRRLVPGTTWNLAGTLYVLTPMVILCYYSVIGGWAVDYLGKALTLQFTTSDPSAISGMFTAFVSGAWTPIICLILFLGTTMAVVAFGVKAGIEKFSKICLPVLFVLVVAIAVYSASLPGAYGGIRYLSNVDFTKLTPKAFALALGQSFFSLSLGMGIITTYSSYVSSKENLFISAVGTSLSDLLFAILAGFAIMPAVFAAGIEPGSGPGLIFDTLPFIFNKMATDMPIISSLAAIIFFVTIFFAALTSSISLGEVGVAYLIEEKKMSRLGACGVVFVIAAVVGSVCSLSMGPLSSIQILGDGILDFLDKFTSNILLGIGGFLFTVFVGWKMDRADVKDEFTNGGTKRMNVVIFDTVYFLIKYVAPVGVATIFATNFFI